MDVIWHHARSVEVILFVVVGVEDAFKDSVALGRSEMAMLVRGKRDHVFPPRAFEMRETTLGVFGIVGCRMPRADREGAVGGTRGACAPHPVGFFVEEF